jgi:N-acetylglucosaminyl-diphospho-decaprenol L-rhamnosyltransferase
MDSTLPPDVDVVVVSYNSADELERCVAPLVAAPGARVVVVDNASSDDTLAVAARLGVRSVALERNGGFARGCNEGWRGGDAPFVLFLNPDAQIDAASVDRLRAVLDSEPRIGAAAPRIVGDDGALAYSQRHFPRLRSGFAQALFLHRVFRTASWTDELVRDPAAYQRPGEPDWVSGACVMVRRADLERLGGWDERFFLYREDIDLCRRLRASGLGIRFEPAAVAVHQGGASSPQGRVIPMLAASRLRYAGKHYRRPAVALERVGVALHALTHAVFGRGGDGVRAGHLRALALAVRPTHDRVVTP